MSSPPPKSLVPAPTVWPPSNPSGTVIPFPLPWGQTGCCPPGGMDALMKCYCDIQQASAFIGQIMLDQINNNPAIIAAIIAGIEKSGSSLPTLGVTDGSVAQPGQVGEYLHFEQVVNYTAVDTTQSVSMGVLPPGDWSVGAYAYFSTAMSVAQILLSPIPAGFTDYLQMVLITATTPDILTLWAGDVLAYTAVPTLVVMSCQLQGGTAGNMTLSFTARRAR